MQTAINKLSNNDLVQKKRGPAPAKPVKYADGGGLYLLHQPNGAMLWRMKYRVAGAEKLLSFGAYDIVTLATARRKRDEAKRIIAEGGDPSAVKKQASLEAKRAASGTAPAPTTFGQFGRDLLADVTPGMIPSTRTKWERQLGYAIRQFDERPIGEISPVEIFDYLRGWQARGKLVTMHEIKQKIGTVFDRAVLAEACFGNPIGAIGKQLLSVNNESYAAIIDPERFGELLLAIDRYKGNPMARRALQFLALTFQRPHMIRFMEWSEINLKAAIWAIPGTKLTGSKMKSRRDHIVPLSRQAIAVLREAEPFTGEGRFVFPLQGDKAMAHAELNKALGRIGFHSDEQLGHGFRASANTMLKEQLGYHQDVIDLQLAHVIKGNVRRAYDRAAMIRDRTAMMNAWADYLDTLRKAARDAARKAAGLRLVED
jgi:integrase